MSNLMWHYYNFVHLLNIKISIKGGTTSPSSKSACFVLKIINIFLKTMHPIVNCPKKPQKLQTLGKPSGSLVVDPINTLTVLIHNLKPAWPTKVSMPLLS